MSEQKTEAVTRESAIAAIRHVEQHNGPGRFAEAASLLAAIGEQKKEAVPVAYGRWAENAPRLMSYDGAPDVHFEPSPAYPVKLYAEQPDQSALIKDLEEKHMARTAHVVEQAGEIAKLKADFQDYRARANEMDDALRSRIADLRDQLTATQDKLAALRVAASQFLNACALYQIAEQTQFDQKPVAARKMIESQQSLERLLDDAAIASSKEQS